jgi:threonine dehydrogenase-like Zn-dependent dehydrogenase
MSKSDTPDGSPETPDPSAVASTMRAVVHDTYGTSEVLRVAQVARPRIKDNEVLVRVHAAGLDRGTWHLMTGRPYAVRLGFGFRAPRNPVIGRDVAGTVEAVGDAVTRFAVGDAVFGIGNGSFAEYTAAREDKLVSKPDNVTFEQAGVVAISALTALQAVRDAGQVRAGQKVLVIGASGGVGSYAVQMPRRSVPRSPAWPARASSIWSGHWAPTTSSTTPVTTSLRARTATTSSSTWVGTRPWRGCGAPSLRGAPR